MSIDIIAFADTFETCYQYQLSMIDLDDIAIDYQRYFHRVTLTTLSTSNLECSQHNVGWNRPNQKHIGHHHQILVNDYQDSLLG